MVTFMCNSCDQTLKKKQLKTHHYNCAAESVTCIDCYKMFVGNDHEGHTTCISEKDKYWGPYAQGKKNMKQNNGQAAPAPAAAKKEEKEAEPEPETKKENTPITFNGWKNTIKAILNQEEAGQLNKSELKDKLKEILIKEDYEVKDKYFNECVDKVLGFAAFEVSKKNVVKYIPPSQRPPKSTKKQ